ncbi:MAG: ATP-grasp fold amidoligase family protein [Bdellovibrionales bacterium]
MSDSPNQPPLARRVIRGAYNGLIDILPDYLAIQLEFFRVFRRFANFRNPRSINEKINWRKLYQKDERFILYSDKIAVKDEIARLVGTEYVTPNLWSGENPRDIPFERLTPPYVIKVNHGWGSNIFVHSQKDVNREEIYAVMAKNLASRHGGRAREWCYQHIQPKILIEPMIISADGEVPVDYKFFCFHGRAHFVQVDYDRFTGHKQKMFDCDWNRLDARYTSYPHTNRASPKPKPWQEMLRVAEAIAAKFDFVRVDLYVTPDDKVRFGETTFYPAAGMDTFTPQSWDYVFGEPWHIPKAGEQKTQTA